MQIQIDWRSFADHPVIRSENIYSLAAATIASAPENEHLTHLVRLLTEIQRAGVDLSMHWDCLLEAIILEEIR